MSKGKQISRLALAAIVATAVAGPVSAQAQQAYDVNQMTGAYTPATTAGADLRTESTKSPIVSQLKAKEARTSAGLDLRSESAKGPRTSTPPPGLPTWSLNPRPIVPVIPEPAATADSGDGSIDWPPAGLIAGGLIALAGVALIARRGHIPAH